MPAYPAHIGRRTIKTPKRTIHFNPSGPIETHGRQIFKKGPNYNPPTWSSRVTYAARLFVGFCVGGEVCHTMDELVALVRAVRRRQGKPEDSTFIAQRGVYTHSYGEHQGRVVDEPGAQIIIIDSQLEESQSPSVFAGTDPGPETEAEQLARLEEEMIFLSEEIAQGFRQESVILEIQRNGAVLLTMGIGERVL